MSRLYTPAELRAQRAAFKAGVTVKTILGRQAAQMLQRYFGRTA